MIAASTGLDQLTHALESLTALPFNRRPAPEHPKLRPAYQGSNPISQIWASRAIEMISQNLVRVIEDPSDVEARGVVLLAATYAGIGFGNGGVHLAHGMSYPDGLKAVGYGPEDVDKIAAATLPQHRVTKLSPRPAGAEDLKQLFLDSMVLW